VIEFLTSHHLEIVRILRNANVEVVTDKHKVCKRGAFDGYTFTYKDPNNKLKKTALVICTKTIQENYDDWRGEINRTLAHEAVHVAQICKHGNRYIQPLGFDLNIEKEAFKIQDKPTVVARILKKYCLQ
jgi:hypothetical protein